MSTHPILNNCTVYREQTIHIIECAQCAIDFGIGDNFMRRRREDHGTFYRPNIPEPFNPAVRVRDKNGDIYARIGDLWVSENCIFAWADLDDPVVVEP
jgi:hypothetical protein